MKACTTEKSDVRCQGELFLSGLVLHISSNCVAAINNSRGEGVIDSILEASAATVSPAIQLAFNVCCRNLLGCCSSVMGDAFKIFAFSGF